MEIIISVKLKYCEKRIIRPEKITGRIMKIMYEVFVDIPKNLCPCEIFIPLLTILDATLPHATSRW